MDKLFLNNCESFLLLLYEMLLIHIGILYHSENQWFFNISGLFCFFNVFILHEMLPVSYLTPMR